MVRLVLTTHRELLSGINNIKDVGNGWMDYTNIINYDVLRSTHERRLNGNTNCTMDIMVTNRITKTNSSTNRTI